MPDYGHLQLISHSESSPVVLSVMSVNITYVHKLILCLDKYDGSFYIILPLPLQKQTSEMT